MRFSFDKKVFLEKTFFFKNLFPSKKKVFSFKISFSQGKRRFSALSLQKLFLTSKEKRVLAPSFCEKRFFDARKKGFPPSLPNLLPNPDT